MARSSVIFPTDVDTKKYVLAMKVFNKKAFPSVVAETLNRTADATTKQQIKNVKKDLTIRTPFTLRSMTATGAKPFKALNKARGNNVDRMFSRAGTFSRYLWKQEESSTQKGVNGPVPIPTIRARIGKNIKRAIRRPFRLPLSQRLSAGDIGNNMFIGKPGGGPKGIYLKSKKGVLTMLRNLESNQIKIRGKGFHKKAVKRFGTQQFIAAQFKKIAKRTLKRKGLT